MVDNNAARHGEAGDGLIGDMEPDAWDSIFAVNARGTMLMCKHAVNAMLPTGGGAIINISSGTSLAGQVYQSAYACSKGAINTLTRYVATQYGTQVLQEPPRSGFTLILWVLPVIALVAGGAWLIYTMRGWSRQEPAPATAEPVSTGGASSSSDSVPADDYLSQVEQDLGLE